MEFIEILKSIFLGIIEGITEWLPISSTGHMILADQFIRLNMPDAFKEMFLVVIQFGAILAVIVLYFHRLNPFSPKKDQKEKKNTYSIWGKVIIGILPAGILGFFLDEWLNAHFYNYITVSLMLILYGILFILVENRNKRKIVKIGNFQSLDYKTAFGIGIFQALSLIPGTSRSGATILGAILLGTSRPIAAEYSFFMSIPIMLAASVLKLVKFGWNFTGLEMAVLLAGSITAFLVSIAAIRFLMRYIRNNDFKVFGWYRIALGVLVLSYFFFAKR